MKSFSVVWALGVGVCECCGREFGLPVRLTVLSAEPEETYFACPFCFTRVEEAMAEVVGSVAVEKPKSARERRKKETLKAGVVAGGCSRHLGYLKGRAKNAAIPDECLVCPKILQCMI